MIPVVKARGLTKYFDRLQAVKGIDFDVIRGECFGLLGPNGAGKSTTVRMIYGFSPVSAGTLEVLGLDITKNAREIKSRLGVVAQDDNLDPQLTVMENLVVYAGYFHIPKPEAVRRAEEMLAFMELEEKAGVRVEHLSGGMRRRLAIARALINQPEMLILDEPTTGLDPQARHLVWQRLRRLKDQGATLLLTTHYLEEASQLCDRLVIMHRGEILEQGEPAVLISHHVGREVLELTPAFLAAAGTDADREQRLQQLGRELAGRAGTAVKSHQVLGDTLYLYTEKGTELLSLIKSTEHDFSHQHLRPATLEDVFLKLTGRGLQFDDGEPGGMDFA